MSAASDKAFTLVVETGLHAGSVQRLASGIYTLGSEFEADIVLADPGVASIHVILELDRQALRLEPVQGSIAVDGESVALEPGGERHLALPVSFTIGDIRLRMSAPQDSVRMKKRVRMMALAAGAVALAVIGVQMAGSFFGGDSGGPAVSLDRQEPVMAAAMSADAARNQANGPLAASKTGASAPPPAVTLDQAAAELRARLASASLTGVEVIAAGDRLQVQGAAEPERMADWREVRMWFDGAFGHRFIMVADVREAEKEEPPKLAIEAIWSGERPYVMAGGRRFHEGAAIGDGWMIEMIQSDEIVFKRGDTFFSLTL